MIKNEWTKEIERLREQNKELNELAKTLNKAVAVLKGERDNTGVVYLGDAGYRDGINFSIRTMTDLFPGIKEKL